MPNLGKGDNADSEKSIIFGLVIFLVFSEKHKQKLIMYRINFQRQMIIIIHVAISGNLFGFLNHTETYSTPKNQI
mgnify:CR=1 FL=1